MFNEKEFLEKLMKYEITNKVDCLNDEINAIINNIEQKQDDDPLYMAVLDGFVLGCMNAERYIKDHIGDFISDIMHKYK